MQELDLDLMCRVDLLKIAQAFAQSQELSLATVSRRFHGNQAFLADLREGECSITVTKLGEMLDEFGDAWPQGLDRPTLNFLRLPARRGVIYVAKLSNAEDRIRIGFSRYGVEKREAGLRVEAKRHNGTIKILGCVKGRQNNERSLHRLLQPHAYTKGERSWYISNRVVKAAVDRILAPGFSWGRWPELSAFDLEYDQFGQRRKSPKKGVDNHPV